MKIYRCLKQDSLTQSYHQNGLPIYKELGMSCHGGMDWACKIGEPIYYDCDIDGYVLNTEIDSSGGLGVNIITESEEGVLKHRYWHLKDFFVKAGDKISMGECIGWGDSTGKSTGSHLHRDVKEMTKNLTTGKLNVKFPNNGTFGAIDFEQWFENKFVLDVVGQDKKQSYLREILIALLNKLLKK
jgi:murein DD-endopeptidase MepM/ murein hydrolase activator NlpD